MFIARAPRVVSAALVGAALMLASAQTFSAGVLGARIFVQHTGSVIATFLGHEAAFTDLLYLHSPAGAFTDVIFNNHTSPVGSTVNLGNFAAGTELVFRLHVENTGNDFFTGNGSNNPDGVPHAVIDAAWQPNTTRVGFEDLHDDVSDHDYDDLIYSFSNTGSTAPIPEPSTYVLLLAGLGFAAVSRRAMRRGNRSIA